MSFGDAFHQALEVWWTNSGTVEDRLSAAHAKFLSAAAENKLSFEDSVLGPELLTGYAVTYGSDELRSHSIPLGECKLEVPVLDPDGAPDDSMVLVARLDEIGFSLNGETVLVEHKTTTSDLHSDTFWARFDSSLQVPLYFIAAADSGRPIASAVLDVIRAPKRSRLLATPPERREFYKRAGEGHAIGDPKPGVRLRDQTKEEYANTLRELIIENAPMYYARKTYVVTPEQITAARGDLWATGRMMQAVLDSDGAAPRNSDGCDKFNSRCGYHPACYGGASLDNQQMFTWRNV